MRILLASVPYRPSIGGIETVTSVLADYFQAAGHEIVLITRTPSPEPDREPFRVVRNPSAAQLWSLARWSDVVFHNNISLKWAWPLVFVHRPWVIAHHTWVPRRGPGYLIGLLKRAAFHRASNIAVSRAIAASLPVASAVVPNPFNREQFVRIPEIRKTRELVFLGRLVSDKGVPVLLDALVELARRDLFPRLTIIGSGPEDGALRAQVERAGLADQVHFAGQQEGRGLVELLNRHQILVVPSVWEEPFGIVVLEALACGCVPVVAQSGGLPDAAGACGIVFPKGDASGLADVLAGLIHDEAELDRLRGLAEAHLAAHAPARVAHAYLQIVDHARQH